MNQISIITVKGICVILFTPLGQVNLSGGVSQSFKLLFGREGVNIVNNDFVDDSLMFCVALHSKKEILVQGIKNISSIVNGISSLYRDFFNP